MNISKLFDAVGGKLTFSKLAMAVAAMEEAHALHARTFSLLRSIKDGTISIDQVTITDGGWEITE